MAVTKSNKSNITSPNGNSLALFVDINDDKLKMKDINGEVQPLDDFVSVSGGTLQIEGGLPITSTLQNVVDQNGNLSQLQLATNATRVTGTLEINDTTKIKTANETYLDIEDGAGNNRFTIGKATGSQKVTLDFASNPTGSTTIVGAIRTYVDGVNLSEVVSFMEDGRVGVGTTTPQAKLDVRTTDGLSSAQLCSNNDSSLPLRLFRANNGLVSINTLSSGGTIDSPSDRSTLGAITRLTGNAYVDGAYRGLARMEYYLDAIPTAGVAPCSIRFLTVPASSSTYSLDERMGITSDGNVQINDSIVNNRNAKLFIKGSGSTSATTSLLVQNFAGTQSLKLGDSGILQIGLTSGINWTFNSNTLTSSQYAFISSNNGSILSSGANNGGVFGNNNGGKVADSGINNAQVASAVLEVSSTTRGFLPPRMTTAQKNAIVTPTAGLVVYDTTLNKLCVYTTAWETITSV